MFATVHVTDDDASFCVGPVKPQNGAVTARENNSDQTEINNRQIVV